jgi:hypothetical protein
MRCKMIGKNIVVEAFKENEGIHLLRVMNK